MTRMVLALSLLLLTACASLPPREEFAAMECKQQTAILYEYALDNRKLAYTGIGIGVVSAATGVIALKGELDIAAGLAQGGR